MIIKVTSSVFFFSLTKSYGVYYNKNRAYNFRYTFNLIFIFILWKKNSKLCKRAWIIKTQGNNEFFIKIITEKWEDHKEFWRSSRNAIPKSGTMVHKLLSTEDISKTRHSRRRFLGSTLISLKHIFTRWSILYPGPLSFKEVYLI